jgi:hypothetical protein
MLYLTEQDASTYSEEVEKALEGTIILVFLLG